MRIDKELIEKIEKITMVDYEVVNNETGCLIPVENIEAVIEDLLLEYNALKEYG
jgi:cysteine sulfinate desulfinase/cysteine desulfurase-like protein